MKGGDHNMSDPISEKSISEKRREAGRKGGLARAKNRAAAKAKSEK